MLKRAKNQPSTTQITVNVPFDFCSACERLDTHKTDYFADGEICARFYECLHAEVCRNAVKLYEAHADKLKTRSERPYDAMGDDQGRVGYTADEAYRKEFVESYDDQEDA